METRVIGQEEPIKYGKNGNKRPDAGIPAGQPTVNSTMFSFIELIMTLATPTSSLLTPTSSLLVVARSSCW